MFFGLLAAGHVGGGGMERDDRDRDRDDMDADAMSVDEGEDPAYAPYLNERHSERTGGAGQSPYGYRDYALSLLPPYCDRDCA